MSGHVSPRVSRRRALSLVTGLASAVVLAACGQQAPATPASTAAPRPSGQPTPTQAAAKPAQQAAAPTQPPAKPTQAPQASGPTPKPETISKATTGSGGTKLVAWTIGPDKPSFYRRDNLIAAADEINKGSAKVTLEATFDTGAWGDYKQRFLLAAEAGQAPDIVLSSHTDIAAWSDAGYIRDLTDMIKAANEVYQDIIPSLWPAVMYKQKRWAIPQDTEARPMYFNRSVLKKAGLSDEQIKNLPKDIQEGKLTLDDMLQRAKDAQDKKAVEPGFGYWHRPSRGLDFYQFVFAFGGQLQDADTGKLVLSRDAVMKHYQFHHDTVNKYGTTKKNFIGTEWKIWHETVSGSKVVFWNGGTWHWAEWQKVYKVAEQKLFEEVGFGPIPTGERGGKPITLSHPLVYMVTKQSKSPDLAFDVITKATKPDLNSKHAVESAHLAILKSQLNDPLYTKDRFLKDSSYLVEYSQYSPNHPKFGSYDEIVFRALTAVQAGQASPKDAVNLVVDELKSQLKDDLIVK